MIEQKDIKIGGKKARIQGLPATKALEVIATLSKITGGFGMGIRDIPSNGEELSDALHIGDMINGFLSKLDPKISAVFIKDVIQHSIIEPNFADSDLVFDDWFDGTFSGNLGELTTLLRHIYLLNYGDPVEQIKKGLAWLEEMQLIEVQSKP